MHFCRVGREGRGGIKLAVTACRAVIQFLSIITSMRIRSAIGLGIGIIVLQVMAPQVWDSLLRVALDLLSIVHNVFMVASAIVSQIHLP